MAVEFFDVFQYVIIAVLIALSGLFSGLTLGLLSLDKVGLQVIIFVCSSPSSPSVAISLLFVLFCFVFAFVFVYILRFLISFFVKLNWNFEMLWIFFLLKKIKDCY